MNNKDVRSFCAMASTMFRYYNACDGITNVFLNWFTGQDSPGGKVILEGKCRAKCATDVHELSQCFATAITFSSIQQRRHPTVHCFPTIRISPRGFDIILYNPEFDLLLICCLGWTRIACVADGNLPVNTVCELVHKSLSETPNDYWDLCSRVWLVSW